MSLLAAKDINVIIATNAHSQVAGEDIYLKGELSRHFSSVSLVHITDLNQSLAACEPSNTVVWFGNVCDFEKDLEKHAAAQKIALSQRTARDRDILVLPTPDERDMARAGRKNLMVRWSEAIEVHPSMPRQMRSSAIPRIAARKMTPPTAQSMDELQRIMRNRNWAKPDAYMVKPVDGESAKDTSILSYDDASALMAGPSRANYILQPLIDVVKEISVFLLDEKPVLAQETADYDRLTNAPLFDPATANTDESREARFNLRWLTLEARTPTEDEVWKAQSVLKLHRDGQKQGCGLFRIDFMKDMKGNLWLAEVDNMPTWALDAKNMVIRGQRIKDIHTTGILSNADQAARTILPGKMERIVDAIRNSIVENMNWHRNRDQMVANLKANLKIV